MSEINHAFSFTFCADFCFRLHQKLAISAKYHYVTYYLNSINFISLISNMFARRLCRTHISPVEYSSPIDRERVAQTQTESTKRRGTLRVAEAEWERVTIQTDSQTAQ